MLMIVLPHSLSLCWLFHSCISMHLSFEQEGATRINERAKERVAALAHSATAMTVWDLGQNTTLSSSSEGDCVSRKV